MHRPRFSDFIGSGTCLAPFFFPNMDLFLFKIQGDYMICFGKTGQESASCLFGFKCLTELGKEEH